MMSFDRVQITGLVVIDCKMDWQGQKLAEQLMELILVSFAAVAFVAGYVLGSFQTMLLIYAAGVGFTTIITIPNWPFFNLRPLHWLDSSEAENHSLLIPAPRRRHLRNE